MFAEGLDRVLRHLRTVSTWAMTEGSRGRRSGILLPLFSCPRTTGWGIGDISDLEAMTAWLAAAGGA